MANDKKCLLFCFIENYVYLCDTKSSKNDIFTRNKSSIGVPARGGFYHFNRWWLWYWFFYMMDFKRASKEKERKRKKKRDKRLARERMKENPKNKRSGKAEVKKKKDIWIRMNYIKDLEDYRWIRKRNQILKRDNFTCQLCESKIKLVVHHKKYISGRRPWQYNNKHLITLCNECHKKEHTPLINAKIGNELLDKEFNNKMQG